MKTTRLTTKKGPLQLTKIMALAFISLTMISFMSSCSKDEDGNLTMNFDKLENLGSSAQYEGWIIVDGSAISTGTFTVDDNGNMSRTAFTVDQKDIDIASKFVLTIEPMPDSDPGASSVHILAGDFNGNTATTTVGHGSALGNDFSSANGKYILATPTTTVTTDENSGVWFLDLSSGSPATGLDLPTLPNGWKYEGWVVVDGTPISSGTFTDVSAMDMNAVFSGSDASAPPFPGEDFIQNAPNGVTFPFDIAGGKVVISIEPSPDNSPNPFSMKPLLADVSSSATDHVTYDLSNISTSNFPSGTVNK